MTTEERLEASRRSTALFDAMIHEDDDDKRAELRQQWVEATRQASRGRWERALWNEFQVGRLRVRWKWSQ